jgi:hypothetical protein
MKKIFISISLLGAAVGTTYWLFKKENLNDRVSKSKESISREQYSLQDEDSSCEVMDTAENLQKAKSENASSIYKRHLDAGDIMKNAYQSIIEDFVDDFSDKKETSLDGESVDVIKEIDSISEKLDELLK